MKAGIAYCGGCNPRFDRVEAVEKLKADVFGVQFLPLEEGKEYDLLAVVCGCQSQCADYGRYHIRQRAVILTKLSDFEALRRTIEELKKEQE